MKKTLLLTAILVFTCFCGAFAQSKKATRKVNYIQVVSRVTDEQGNPIENATITAGEGAITCYTAADGSFRVRSKADDYIVVEAEGYKTIAVNLKGGIPQDITLAPQPFLKGDRDIVDRSDGGTTYRRELITASDIIDAGNLSRYPDLSISNALQGRAPGLIVRADGGGLGYNTSSIFVRGLHSAGTNAIVVIDGIERPIDNIIVEEIGSIEVLKDASAKILYGSRATNGVVLIKTKRGELGKRVIRTTAEYGVTTITRSPKFLDSYQYANLYNEARHNDGLEDYYLPYQIEGYKNSTGENDLLYPNIDWYDKFTSNMGTYRKLVGEFIGGNEHARYSLITGYTGGTGLEKVGGASNLHRFNIRGNLDMQINGFLTATADVAARLSDKNWSGLTSSNLYSKLSSYRPNEYPFLMDAAAIGLEPQEDNAPYYGGSILHNDNVYDSMSYGGDKSERYVSSQTNLGLKFDFDKYVKGLFADAFITFDNYNYVQQGITRNHPTYAVDEFIGEKGAEERRLTQLEKINQNDNIAVIDEYTTRRLGFRADGGYKRSFGLNDFSAIAAFSYYKDEAKGASQDLITTNGTLRLNYAYNSRLFAEMVVGVVGSNQFASNNRNLFTGAIGLAYVISEKPFVKVKANAGRLGFNANNNYLLYKNAWASGDKLNLGNNNNFSVHTTNLSVYGNPNIGWVTSNEANLGLEGFFLGRKLEVEANAFVEFRENMITGIGSLYSDLIGDYLGTYNYGTVRNMGAEFMAKWHGSTASGNFRYNLGVNFIASRNSIVKANEISNMEDYRKTIGRPTSAIYGLQSEGLFGKDVAIEGHARQGFGYYTDGDIAYKDLNGDDIIDTRDETYLGQAFPIGVIGVDLDINYKGFGFYVLGTAEIGASAILNNNYYWNTGSNAYTSEALKRYHAANNPDGTLPRLTTTSGSNSYRTSDFWVKSADWCRLKNVELSYTFENRGELGNLFKSVKVFARSTNLLVVSPIKDLDPEVLDAGVTNYPVLRTITGGLTVVF